ncbi:MAG: heparin lyase I family protein [Paraglaciecola sp.]|uniref:heparin lyase I family protein n=1 Tax=Paraglaciecola sp. TaxID=1920173 RepID=UPI00329812A7
MLKILLLLLLPLCASACPNWQPTINDNQALGWDYQLNPHNISIVKDPINNLSQVIKLVLSPDSTWPNGHTRTEVKHNGCATNEGDSTFFSWEFLLDNPIKTSNDMAYWETDNSYLQSMGFYLTPNRHNNKISTELTFFSSLPKRKIHWQDTVTIGEWNKIAMAITWSESQKSGRISVWYNNRAILTELQVKTKPDTNKLFVQLGLHRNQAERVIDNIYLRNIKETANLSTLLKR